VGDSLFESELDKAGFVARVENETGHYVAQVEEVTILPAISGECACGNHVPAFINVQWCDECFAAFDAKIAENHPDPFEGPRERWRANGWKEGS
jgi:hypothetical protein